MKDKIKILYYKCKKCGFGKEFLSNEQINTKCKMCGNEMTFAYSRKYNPNNGLKAIKNSNTKSNNNTEFFKAKELIIECPYCHSTNTKKIGLLNRTVSVGLLGLGSKKIGKQFHCKNCNSDF